MLEKSSETFMFRACEIIKNRRFFRVSNALKNSKNFYIHQTLSKRSFVCIELKIFECYAFMCYIISEISSAFKIEAPAAPLIVLCPTNIYLRLLSNAASFRILPTVTAIPLSVFRSILG